MSHQRNSFVLERSGLTAQNTLEKAYSVGSAAMGNTSKGLEVGETLDPVIIDTSHPALFFTENDQLLSKWLYAGDATANAGTICKGQWVVKEQQHEKLESLRKGYHETLKQLYQKL